MGGVSERGLSGVQAVKGDGEEGRGDVLTFWAVIDPLCWLNFVSLCRFWSLSVCPAGGCRASACFY